MFFGMAVADDASEGGDDEILLVVRQLESETVVAAVATLLALVLLYLVNADVDVVALEVVDIELRQLECVELALEATGRPLLALAGERARLSLAATYRSKLPWGLMDDSCPEDPQLLLPLAFRYGKGCLG
jgi:hypothetical protein